MVKDYEQTNPHTKSVADDSKRKDSLDKTQTINTGMTTTLHTILEVPKIKINIINPAKERDLGSTSAIT